MTMKTTPFKFPLTKPETGIEKFKYGEKAGTDEQTEISTEIACNRE